MEWVDVVSPQRIGFICIKIPDLLRRAGGTRDDAALSGLSRVSAMARGFPESTPALCAAGHCTRMTHLWIRVVKVGQIRPYLVQWCSDVKNDGISERGDWPL
ncbi:hypothetical protein [Yersinia kristensenii]|uniref:hypothetical protein n=1 Tax=Yersinia kristensenii TaxID=28152 RepID=UPI0011CB6131|nr:hypothetical protein [Yersinia kristensenii]